MTGKSPKLKSVQNDLPMLSFLLQNHHRHVVIGLEKLVGVVGNLNKPDPTRYHQNKILCRNTDRELV